MLAIAEPIEPKIQTFALSVLGGLAHAGITPHSDELWGQWRGDLLANSSSQLCVVAFVVLIVGMASAFACRKVF